jgi:hypothetical protein
MNLNNLTILVCLYNKQISESDTIQSLLKIDSLFDKIQLIIWDNSPMKNSVGGISSIFKNVTYIHTPKNTPLSKIYNKTIENQTDENCFLMICDDDSIIPLSFFNNLQKSISSNTNINLFLPIVKSNEQIISPAKNYIIKSKHFKNLEAGVISTKNITAINSCMVISNKVFTNGFKYDEKLTFYGTDDYFMYHFSKNYTHLCIIDEKIKHNLSMNNKDILNKLRIFKQIKKANKIIYKDNLFERNLSSLNILIVSLKLALKYKDLEFFYD